MTLLRSTDGRALPWLQYLLLLGIIAQLIVSFKVDAISLDCVAPATLHGKLKFENRATFMKYNFPINYTIDVPRILIFRKRNVTQLLRNWKVNMEDLRLLWGSVSRNVLQKILAVLTPEKHPSWNFTHELLAIINAMVADMAPPQSEFVIQRIKRVLNPKPADAIKSVHPKALVDNCYRVLLVLYKDACNLKDASSRRRPLVPARSKSPSTPTAI
ncbi:interleukin-34 [Pleurodeles waltl]|uniref:interleukin-34 n=1 Tax=Pleurodeles waltl TaxID=8319 RepID=UPI003709AB39